MIYSDKNVQETWYIQTNKCKKHGTSSQTGARNLRYPDIQVQEAWYIHANKFKKIFPDKQGKKKGVILLQNLTVF